MNDTPVLGRFPSQSAMLARWQSSSRQSAFAAETVGEFTDWRDGLRTTLRGLIGYDRMTAAPANPRVGETEVCDGFTRTHLVIDVEPGVAMTLYVLAPATGDGPWPVMIAPHGHCSGGKLATGGRDDIPEVKEQIDIYNYGYGIAMARAGFIVFCPDARGFGERQEANCLARGILSGSCDVLNHMGVPLGLSVTGMWTWELHRLIDYIETRPDCDASRLGCGGLSGGGLQTLWAAALDDRIRVAVVSGYFYGVAESLLIQSGNCSCNYVPGVWEHVDMGDLGALIAPRPLLIETGSHDPLNGASGLDNVYPQVAQTRRAYALHGADDALVHDVFPGGHRWHGDPAIAWLAQHLGASGPV